MKKYWETWSISKVEDAIVALDISFNDGQDPIFDGRVVSNTDYDLMRNWLRSKKPRSAALALIDNARLDPNATTFKHVPAFVSLNKINHEKEAAKYAELIEWLKERQKDINWDNFDITDNYTGIMPMFTQAYKIDGVAGRIYYEEGKLVKAGLRPHDGDDGEDVSKNVKYIQCIPEYLPKPYTLSITGEFYVTISDFHKINKKLFEKGEKLRANPRAATVSGIRQFLDPKKTKEGRVRFIGYSIENFEGKLPYKDEMHRAKWCNTVLGVPFLQVRPFRVQDLKAMEENVPNLDYEVDGVVISVRNLEEQEQCGRHGRSSIANPKGKVAWKFQEQSADVKVKNIIWQVGRTGRIVPVLIFDGVILAGTTVTRATAHNFGFLERNRIGIGTIVKIIKSGKIIPKVIGVVKYHMTENFMQTYNWYPNTCPCCAGKVAIQVGGKVKGSKEQNKDLQCLNAKCGARNIAGLCHYLQTFGVKGIAESIAGDLIQQGVDTWSDLYQLTVTELSEAGLSHRQALLTIAAIHMISNPSRIKSNDLLTIEIAKAQKKRKKVKAAKLIAALGIPNIAEGTGDILINHFKTIDNLLNAHLHQLAAIPDIGMVKADSIVTFFDENDDKIQRLLKHLDIELPAQGNLSDTVFVLSGTLPQSKEYWKARIEEQGGIVKTSVGRGTHYLVAGPGSGSKSEKAEEMGIKIIDTEQLEKMLNA